MPARVRRISATREARSTKAFLFSDLRDYTSFVETNGDAAAARLLREYRTLVRREVARYEGAEVKTEGDSFYVVFVSPSSAIECAVSIVRAAESHTASRPESPLRVGIGVHAGEAVEYDDQFVGSAVNVASRLAGKAGAMEVVVSDTVRGLARTSSDIAMTPRGPLQLKGVHEPIRAWTVNWRGSATPGTAQTEPYANTPSTTQLATTDHLTHTLLCPVVVGRRSELSAVEQLMERAAAGSGSTLLIGGEAGVGKSALVRRAKELAVRRGFRVLTGLSDELGAGLPYAPFVSAIRSAFAGHAREHLLVELTSLAPELIQLFPELSHPADSVRSSDSVERTRLSVVFRDVLRSFAREAATLVILEDLHWSDEASFELLRYVSRELSDERLLVLATYRSDELHRRHPLTKTLAVLQRERLVSKIELRRLDRDGVAELVATTLGALPRVMPQALIDAIFRRCDGNPFFAEELLRTLADEGALVSTDSGWTVHATNLESLRIPESIVETVRARVERLPDDVRRTLDAASVIGAHFPTDLFGIVEPAASVDVSFEGHLRELADVQLVRESPSASEPYSFRHALTREVVYQDLLPTERKRLHHAVASALMRSRTAEPAIIAHHLMAAGLHRDSVPYLIDAAERAQAAGAPREAAALYRSALEIGLEDEQIPSTLQRLGEAYLTFDVVLAAKTADEARARYETARDREGVSRAHLLASKAWRRYPDGRRALEHALKALDAVSDDASLELGRATANLADLRVISGAWQEAATLADRAISLGERFADPWTLSNALIIKGRALRFVSMEEALTLVDRGRELAIRDGLRDTTMPGYTIGALIMGFLRRPLDARRKFIDEGLDYARRYGIEESAHLEYMLASIIAATGDWDAALAVTSTAHESHRQYSLGLEAMIKRGRNGPAAALPLSLEVAEFGVRSQFAWDFIWAIPQAATACLLAGQDETGRAWLARLRQRLDEDADARAQAIVLGGAAFIAATIVAALLADEPDWIRDIEAGLAWRKDPAMDLHRAEIRAIASIFSGNTADTPRHLTRLFEEGSEHWGAVGSGGAWYTVICVREAGRRGLALNENWRPVITAAREFSERARASWYLDQLTRHGVIP